MPHSPSLLFLFWANVHKPFPFRSKQILTAKRSAIENGIEWERRESMVEELEGDGEGDRVQRGSKVFPKPLGPRV